VLGNFSILKDVESNFGIKISQEMVRLDARVLPAPKVQYGGNSTHVPQDGSWNMRGKKFVVPMKIDSWAVLVCARSSSDEVKRFVSVFVRGCEDVGMAVGMKNPPIIMSQNEHLRNLKTAYEAAQSCSKSNRVQFILVVLPVAKVIISA
jgi:eukaryotic translation initiation factor 2C